MFIFPTERLDNVRRNDNLKWRYLDISSKEFVPCAFSADDLTCLIINTSINFLIWYILISKSSPVHVSKDSTRWTLTISIQGLLCTSGTNLLLGWAGFCCYCCCYPVDGVASEGLYYRTWAHEHVYRDFSENAVILDSIQPPLTPTHPLFLYFSP